MGAPLPRAERGDVDRITEAAKAALGQTAFAEAFQRGATLSPEEAALTATKVLPPAPSLAEGV
ncbi:hypothetical protein [Nonomuraea roseola]|uniref:hypothetical protein n=1 Tax=Nonomuraea roseola TaxID=46179 RepID=UPI0031F726DF